MKKFIASLFIIAAFCTAQSSQAQGTSPKSPNRSDNHVPPGQGGTPPGQGGPKPGNGPKPKTTTSVSVANGGGSTVKPTIASPTPSLPPAANTANWPNAPERPVISGKKN